MAPKLAAGACKRRTRTPCTAIPELLSTASASIQTGALRRGKRTS